MTPPRPRRATAHASLRTPGRPVLGAVRAALVGGTAAALVAVVTAVALPAQAVTASYTSTLLAGSSSGTAITTSTSAAATGLALTGPRGVAVDSLGNTYVADTGHHLLEKITASGTLTVLAGTGTAGAPSASQLSSPHGLAVDGSRNVFVADTGNSTVDKVSTSGVVTVVAGTGVAGVPGVAGSSAPWAATSSPLNAPQGVAVDSSGTLYIADTGNNQVEKVDSTGLTIIAGTGAAGSTVGSDALHSQLSGPQGVAVDSSGNLYIADSGNNRIVKLSGTTLSVLATGLASPSGLAVDPSGTLYATTSASTVSTVSASGGTPTALVFAAGAASGSPAAFTAPAGITVTSAGTVYVTDATAGTVTSLTPSGTSAAPTITSPQPKGTAAKGVAYSTTFTATGFPVPTWSVLTGTLPAGLSLNAATGVLSGTPTATGTSAFTVRASNSVGAMHDDQAVTLVVGAGPAAPTAPKAVAGLVSATLSWTAPTAASTAAADAITGYVITPTTGGTAGTPVTSASTATTQTVTGLKAGSSYTFTVAATDGYGTGTASTATTAVIPFGGPTALGAGTHRVSGPDRLTTALTASQALFPTAGSARAVVVASSTSYADALAGARLASADASPLLLVNPAELGTSVAAEVKRVLSPTGSVYVLGGTSAVSAAVMTSLTGLSSAYTVTRLAGTDRFTTAVAIAAQITTDNPGAVPDSAPIYLADGRNYPDGLAVSALAARTGGLVLLTDGSTMPEATQTYLTAHDPNAEHTVPVGGPAAKAAGTSSASRAIVGSDRYDTARLVAARFTAPSPTGVAAAPVGVIGLATGTNWPDALVGSAAMGDLGGPLLLTSGSSLQPATATAIGALTGAGKVASTAVFGGTATVPDTAVATFTGLAVSGS